MPDSAVTIDRLQSFQIGLQFATEIPLDHDVEIVDRVNDRIELLGAEVLGPDIRVNLGRLKNPLGIAGSDSVDVWQRRFDAFIAGNFDSEKSGHKDWWFGMEGS